MLAKNRYPQQPSGGMKQRVAIARVLANDADIVRMASHIARSPVAGANGDA